MGLNTFLQIGVFLIAAMLFGFSLWRIAKGATTKSMALLLTIAMALLLVSLFAPRIISLKFKDVIELNLTDIKEAAELAVEKNPQLAQQVSGKSGQPAIDEARAMIRNAQSESDLEKIIKVEKREKDVVFTPAQGRAKFTYPVRLQSGKFTVAAPVPVNSPSPSPTPSPSPRRVRTPRALPYR